MLTIMETEFVISKLRWNLTEEFYQMFKKELTLIPSIVTQEMKDIFCSLYEASITLIPKSDKDSTLQHYQNQTNKNPTTDQDLSWI